MKKNQKDEEERIQLARYQKIDEELYERENQTLSSSASTTIPDYDLNKPDRSLFRIGGIFLICLAVIIWFARSSTLSSTIISPPPPPSNNPERITNEFDELGRFVMKNYDLQKPMSSFLPGLGGIWGVPMWAFYVNRGQGLTAFGVDNKDGAIAKYNSAEKAYQQTPFTGFRTFLKGQRNGIKWEHMPFFPHINNECTAQREMRVGMNELEINEIEEIKQIETNILYFTIPEEEFPGLIRRVTITNTNNKEHLSLEILDGLTKLEPSGIPNGNLDSMGRTMEAWMNVYNIKDDDSTQPFFHISQGTADAAQVQIIKFGHFVVGYLEGVYYSNGTRAPSPKYVPSSDDDDDDDAADASAEKNGASKNGASKNGASTKNTNTNSNTNMNELDEKYELLPFIVDPSVVFDTDTSLVYPTNFFSSNYPSPHEGSGVDELFQQSQGTTSRTPCAYTGVSLLIPPNGYMVLTTIYGHSNTLEEFLTIHSLKVQQKGYIDKKLHEARNLVVDITSRVETNTSSSILNKYIQQSFLDNILRGGLPVQLGDLNPTTTFTSSQLKHLTYSPQPKIYHVFSRIHGDLERDYNFFNIDTTYFSQGPGNFRDINQNRRIDVNHSPFINDYNIKTFLSFIQTDGYNPLTVASPLFILSSQSFDVVANSLQIQSKEKLDELKLILLKPFRIGQLLKDMKVRNIQSKLSPSNFINLIISISKQSYAGQYAQNGFWTDHWTYTLDLIKSYLSVFPDREEEMMYDLKNLDKGVEKEGSIPFYMSPAIVKPRSQRYVLVSNPNNISQKSVRVYNAVIAWGEKGFPQTRFQAMMRIFQDPNYVGGSDGAGGVWQRCKSGTIFTVTPIIKLSMLAILKFSTLDPLGMGIEMEGGKPGWNDAMNGLPGLIGSEMSETYEMLQIIRYLQSVLQKYSTNMISFPTEFHHFITSLDESLVLYSHDLQLHGWSEEIEFNHWNRSNNARELYREQMIAEASCHVHIYSSTQLLTFLIKLEKKIMEGINRALQMNEKSGVSPTYFYYDCIEYDSVSFMSNITNTLQTIVTPKKFSVNTLPLFLEGAVRHMKTVSDTNQLQEIYTHVKQSELYDTPLQMFKISGSLKEMGQEIGRMVAFSPGWLENESIWLHMSYKFYLELLRGKLYDAFYLEITTGVVAFMDSNRFGRSPLEVASFIVSSAFPDKKLHGAGFLARLSGSTAEFLSMWIILTQGHQSFYLDSNTNQLMLTLSPVLARWLFYSDGTASFTFLGEIKVIYHNPLLLDTWNLKPVSYELTSKRVGTNGEGEGEKAKVITIQSESIPTEYALKVRNLEFEQIDVYLG